ncbi:MAG: alginate export family protein [Bacteroidota bacterium]
MRTSFYNQVIPGCLLSLLVTVNGFSQFTLDAQLRPRFEIRNGYQRLIPDTVDPAFLISQRTRLSFGYENKFLKVKITPQDVRIWGDERISSSTGVFGDQASMDLFEGYIELRLGPWARISTGRQQLVYDNERILAPRNWNQTGIAYDAVVAKMGWRTWEIHVGGSWNTLAEAPYDNPYPASRIKSLDFAWVNWDISNGIQASLMHVASGVTQTDTTNRLFWKQTSGVYAEAKWKGLKCWFDGFYQYGRNPQGLRVSAFLFDGHAEYAIKFFTPGLGISYLSGNSNTGTALKEDHLFDVLYGARHKYFGYMDYFRNFSKDTKQGGLIDCFLSLKFTLLKKISILNMAHYFQLAQLNPSTPSTRNLAFENDLVINYKFADWGILESGYSFLLPTSGFKTMQGVQDNAFAQFYYLQLTISPTLFTYPFKESKSN